MSISRYHHMKMKTYNKFQIRSTYSYDTVLDSIFTFRTIKFGLRKNIITVWTWITCFLLFCPIWLPIRNETCSQNSKGGNSAFKSDLNLLTCLRFPMATVKVRKDAVTCYHHSYTNHLLSSAHRPKSKKIIFPF